IRRIDLASLLMAILTGIIFVALLHTLASPTGISGLAVVPVIFSGLIWSIYQLTQFFFFAIIIMVIASFIAPGNYNPALALIQSLLEPIMGPIRRILPPFGPLDLSPMVVLLLIYVLQNLLMSI
ncbi:MAG: YggT family protein, partial [Pseudomonadales bacterium]